MSEVWNPFIIALVGAPGSGKTETARMFKDLIDPVLEERKLAPLTVVDNLDKMIEERQNRAVGVFGDGYVTMMLYFIRQALLDNAMMNKAPILICGSLFDNLAHVNARIKLMGKMVQTPETEGLMGREVMAGQVLATYLMDNRFEFNFGYYLPLPPQVIVPGSERGTFAVEVDDALLNLKVAASLDLPVIEGAPSERAQKILDDTLSKWPPSADAPAVDE